MSDKPHPAQTYAISPSVDFGRTPPDLHQGLFLLLVDGLRDYQTLCSLSPMDAETTAIVVGELEAAEILFSSQKAPPAGDDADEDEHGQEEAPSDDDADGDEDDADHQPEDAASSSAWVNPGRSRRPKKPATAAWVNPRHQKAEASEQSGAPEQSAPEPAAPTGNKEKPVYLRCPLFELNLDRLPYDVVHVIPALTGNIDPQAITGDASEYFLLSRLDGIATIQDLHSITGSDKRLLLERLAKHHHSGSVGFPQDFVDKYLTPKEQPEPVTTTPGSSSPAKVTPPEITEALKRRMAEDPTLSRGLSRCQASLPSGELNATGLGPSQCLVLSLVSGGASVEEVIHNGPGDRKAILLLLLELYTRFCIRLEAPERPKPIPKPKSRTKAPAKPTPPDGAAPAVPASGSEQTEEESEDVLEIEYQTGEYVLDDLLDAAGLDPGDATATDAVVPGATDTAEPMEFEDPEPMEFEDPEPMEFEDPEPMEFEDPELVEFDLPPPKQSEPRANTPTDELFAIPPELTRGKERVGYEKEWTGVPYRGEFSDIDFKELLDFLVSSQQTGILHARQGANYKHIYFAKGCPVYTTSTFRDDQLGSLLWKKQVLSKEDYLQLERACRAAPEQPVWEVLEEMLVLVPDEIEEARRDQLVHIVAGLLDWRIGQYLFVGKERLPSDLDLMPVEAEKILLQISQGKAQAAAPPIVQPAQPVAAPPPAAPAGPQPRVPPKDIERWIQSNYDLYLIVPEEAVAKVLGLRVGERERRYLDALSENRHRLRETMAMSSLGRTKTHKFLVALWSQGLVELVEEIDKEDEALRNLESLNKWLVRLETGDLFQAVGTHPSATGHGLQTAYRKEKKRFDPEKFEDREGDFRKSIERVNRVLDRSIAALKDAENRRAYRLKTYGPERLRSFADVQCKKAEVSLFFRQDYAHARELFESAWDLCPDDNVALAHYGYCYYRSQIPNKREMARGIGMVEAALKATPKEARVCLLCASVERERGDPQRAKELIERARKSTSSKATFMKMMTTYGLAD